MNRKLFKKSLIDRDLKQAEFAREIGYSPEHLSGVINGRFKSKRARKVIAFGLGVRYVDLWGPEERPGP